MYWIAFGDIHEHITPLESIPDLEEAEGIIITGDLTNRGDRVAADRVISAIAARNSNILAQLGNMDTTDVTEYLAGKGMNLHLQVRELAPGLGVMGVGMSARTPFGTPSEVDDETLGEWLDRTRSLAEQYDRLILAVHEPPRNTRLDMLPDGTHVGSLSVRVFIERAKPDLVLTGHIHEGTGMDMIGNTPVFNPGMFAGGGYVRVDWDGTELDARLMSI